MSRTSASLPTASKTGLIFSHNRPKNRATYTQDALTLCHEKLAISVWQALDGQFSSFSGIGLYQNRTVK
jgi:hypothetical protein